jgi:hypothetical protein
MQAGVKPNKLALVAIVAAGSGIGLFPFLLFIDTIRYLIVVVIAAAALTAFLALRRLNTDATEEPSLGEWLLGAWSAVGYPSTIALFALVIYSVAFGLVALASYVAKLLGFDLSIDPSRWGYWVSLAFAGFPAPAYFRESAEDLFHNLYPRTAGSRSAFFPLLGMRLRIAIVLAASIGALAIMVVFDFRRPEFPIFLALLLFYTSFPLSRLAHPRPGGLQTEITEKLARLLEGAGYKVIRSPRTGKPEIDPLIQSIDMLARGNDSAFAVEVKSRGPAVALEWNEAAVLRTASSVLGEELADQAEPRVPVQPILVLVGGKIAPGLERFSKEERVPVLHLADPSMLEADPAGIANWFQAVRVAFAAGQPPPSLGGS